jgi:hypothetical protein
VLSALPVKTTQNANLAPLANSPLRLRRFPQPSHSAPASCRGITGVSMVCFQVTAQFAFIQHKSVLVSTHIKKQNARAFLVLSGLPFGSGLKVRHFFKAKKEAVRYVSHLHAVYKNRIVPNPAMDGGYKNVAQLYLFQEVSE